MKARDRVINIFTKQTGVIVRIWDGKYKVDYYEGEQYNPYRVMVEMGEGVGNFKMEHLELETVSQNRKEV